MKSCFYLIILNIFSLLTSVMYGRAELNLEKMKIYLNESGYENIGYDNCNMQLNGEIFIVSHIIKPGDTVFDVGAHKGDWAKLILNFCSKINIYTFEPIPHIFECLKKNILFDQAYFFNVALSNKNGEEKFIIYNKLNDPALLECSSFFNRSVLEKNQFVVPTYIDVETITLDFFCEKNSVSHIDFLKIDTEGSELNVLKGAADMLQNGSISAIQFEYGGTYKDAGISLKEVYFLLKEREYIIFRIVSDGLICIDQWHDDLETYRYSNYLALAPNMTSFL